MDKLKLIIISNKKSIVFLFILMIIAIISGSIFNIILNDVDKKLVQDSLNNFFANLKELDYINTLKTGLLNQSTFIIIIWLLGLSIIGIPIILFSFFSKIFVLGFSVSSLITTYGGKGILYALLYIFPHHIINIINYGFLTIISLKVSISLLYAIIKARKIDFKPIMRTYLISLGISIILGIISVLAEIYLMPFILQFVY